MTGVQTCALPICAKAILDLGRTLEYLETKGVPVIGYQTSILPAFYTRTSKYKVNFELDTPSEIALFCKNKWDLNLKGGVLVTNPIKEEDSLDEELMNSAISEALNSASKDGITGKEITPYLLAKVKELTAGKSLESNIKLVYNNCHLAALAAKAYFEIEDNAK